MKFVANKLFMTLHRDSGCNKEQLLFVTSQSAVGSAETKLSTSMSQASGGGWPGLMRHRA